MNITRHIRQLEQLGFSEETLDRAIALAGGSRLAYLALCTAVEREAMSPEAALRAVEQSLLDRQRGF